MPKPWHHRSQPITRLLQSMDETRPYLILDVLTDFLREHVGALSADVMFADYAEMTLEIPRGVEGGAHAEGVLIEGTEPGRCYRTQTIIATAAAGVHHVYVPITLRADRKGVLRVALERPATRRVLRVLTDAAITVAYVISAARGYTDIFEQARRRRDLELAAEIQWELLPVLACDTPEFSLAGSLEPAYEVGGDSFDYAIEAGSVTISVTDAMGHGLGAAVLGSLAVNAMRNTRRRGGSIVDQVETANRALHSQIEGTAFVTGLTMRIDLTSGEVSAVNSGHPAAWRVRGDHAEIIDIPPDVPMGLWADSRYSSRPAEVALGDRLILVSDGVFDCGRQRGDAFGEARFTRLLSEARGLPPPEFVRKLTAAITEHGGGEALMDDATVLCLDWKRSAG